MRLLRAPSEPCPHCGRVTKTVDGVCADCWGRKVIDAQVVSRPPRTEPLGIFDFGIGWEDPWGWRVAIGVAVVVAGVVLAWILG